MYDYNGQFGLSERFGDGNRRIVSEAELDREPDRTIPTAKSTQNSGESTESVRVNDGQRTACTPVRMMMITTTMNNCMAIRVCVYNVIYPRDSELQAG